LTSNWGDRRKYIPPPAFGTIRVSLAGIGLISSKSAFSISKIVIFLPAAALRHIPVQIASTHHLNGGITNDNH
jgi:hypothetical protein